MKYQNSKKVNLLLVVMLLFLSFKATSQNTQQENKNVMETISTSGKEATGTTGTVSYSIGQVFYTYVGESSVYNLAQGIQHQEAVAVEPAIVDSTPEIFIFPNPTSNFVYLNMKGIVLQNGQQSYQLYDIQGRLLEQAVIDQIETQINVSYLNPSVYILRVFENNKVLKIFKIIKK